MKRYWRCAEIFVGDLLFDSGAKKKKEVFSPKEIGAALLAVISGVVAWAEQTQNVAHVLFGLPAVILPFLLLASGIGWSLLIITSKEKHESFGFGASDSASEATYRYGQVTRGFGKIALVVLLCLSPKVATACTDQIIPLPNRLYGYIEDSRSGKPIDDARIRVVTAEGVDVTAGEWRSDSYGFYTVWTSRRVTRSASLEVYRQGCRTPQQLSLQRSFEMQPKASIGAVAPIFHHRIEACDSLSASVSSQ